ncbi:MAG: adenylosuccinate synthase [Planctomycetales bacterium]|nr:adenylosuccinate synthase [Planctomycetales bacterium]
MPGTCVIGLQWGDEAKGKLVDLLTAENDIVVRFLGGANAGHTVVTGGATYKLHHVPSGILNPGVVNIIAPGVVLNPPTILQEIDSLTARGVHVGGDNLMLSERMHVVFPWHLAEDRAMNDRPVDGESIGTTLRGIGPCYRDKVGRSHGIRLGDLYRADFPDKVRQVVEFKQRLLTGLGDQETLDAEAIIADYLRFAERLKPHVADTTSYLLDAVEQDRKVLYEGAQGALLDIDHGTFPFVTSSNASGVGVSAGSGVPPRWINKVIGVAKAYSTRVGGGPFPTEQDNEAGQRIRQLGNEYGTTTGRPRRCGWFDAVAVRYTTRLSGVSGVALMMLDVLSQLPEVKICTAYELDGQRISNFPCHADDLRRVTPIYEAIPGWQVDVTGVRKYEDLPQGAKDYVRRVGKLLGRPVEIVSVGPDRAQTMDVPAVD